MTKKLIIIGAGGHGKVAADIANKMGIYEEICFLDDAIEEETLMGYPVVGKCESYVKWRNNTEFFVAIGNSNIRQEWIEKLKKSDCTVISLIHPQSVIGQDVTLDYGTVVMAGAVINSGTKIGIGAIVNTGSSVDHDNQIDDYCHISVGAHLAGTVTVGKHTMIGAGATVINNVNIHEHCMIGAGAVVAKNIEEEGTYVGVPARKKN